ncbi:MAG: hypothetical protein PHF63_00710 [Herbinix sp.]|nr:hypothetical protein [Herbinix sp.]
MSISSNKMKSILFIIITAFFVVSTIQTLGKKETKEVENNIEVAAINDSATIKLSVEKVYNHYILLDETFTATSMTLIEGYVEGSKVLTDDGKEYNEVDCIIYSEFHKLKRKGLIKYPEKEIEEIKEEIIINKIESVHDRMDTVSNLNKEQVLTLLDNSYIEGDEDIAQAILDIEKDYNINAFAVIGIMKTEAGIKIDSHYAKNNNNLFGIYDSKAKRYRSFNSKEECIHYFGKLISGKSYFGRGNYTLKDINPTYNPANSGWADYTFKRIMEVTNKLIV